MITLELHWWMIPIIVVLCGGGLGTYIGSHSRGGFLDITPLVAIAVFGVSCIAAICVCIGHWIS